MTDRGERREEIKLIMEYVKLALSVVGVASLGFAVLQWMHTNRVATQTVYQRIATEWRDHLRTFVENPDLRPYFEDGKHLDAGDDNQDTVLAVADVRLDVMDAVLTYAALHSPEEAETMYGWHNTFANAFRTSPVLCARLNETLSNYGLIVKIGQSACGPPSAAATRNSN